jgi:exodeoxyribonuclease VII small subunit
VSPTSDSQEPTFEQARAELERIVVQLERGEAELEDAIALWERGESLYRLCLAKLDAAQGRIEHLGRELAGAAPRAEGHEAPPTRPVEGDASSDTHRDPDDDGD